LNHEGGDPNEVKAVKRSYGFIKNKYLFLAIVGSSLFVQCDQDQKFDKEIWKNEPEQRYKQVNDLINSKILLGKSKQEVRVLLTNDCKYCDDTNNSWMYYLGEGNDNKDFRWEVLDVEFKNDKVFNISIRK